MRTSQQWWDEVKNSPEKLIEWLQDQYHGEVTAAIRIEKIFGNFPMPKEDMKIVKQIAKEEDIHAAWIADLLKVRGIEPKLLDKEERYWSKTLVDMHSVEDVAAIAHHAEHMRLERIKVIAADVTAPYDIVKVFRKILPMELRHEQVFAQLSCPEVIEAHRSSHELGKQILGLVA